MVYEDKQVFAFLDKHPINPGHILVIPKKHVADFYTLDKKNYTTLLLVVQKLSKRVKRTMRPKKVGIIVAGFDVPHAHIHIVPMNRYHDITSKSLMEGKRADPTSTQLAKTAQKLR